MRRPASPIWDLACAFTFPRVAARKEVEPCLPDDVVDLVDVDKSDE
jgi:hypothetical protein